MIIEAGKNILRFLFFILLQVTIIRHLDLGIYFNPFLFVGAILMLPFRLDKSLGPFQDRFDFKRRVLLRRTSGKRAFPLVPKLHLGTQVSPQLRCFSQREAQLRRQARSQVQLGNEGNK